MRKASKGRKAGKSGKRPREVINPLVDLLGSLDPLELAMLRQNMMDDLGMTPDMLGIKDAVGQFEDYLKLCELGDEEDEEDVAARSEMLAELVNELGELRISANGGDRGARADCQEILDLLAHAIDNKMIDGPDLMMLGKVFSDAGWEIPANLRKAVAEDTDEDGPGLRSSDPRDFLAPLIEMMDHLGQNPFDVYEQLHSLAASMPPEMCAALLDQLLASKSAPVAEAIAGFLLHPDAAVAGPAAAMLARAASQTQMASVAVERVARMRPWLPAERQAQLDPLMRAMRANALPPVKPALPTLLKCYLSVCDGAGTRNLLASQRVGSRYQIVTVMMKPGGAVEAMIIPDLSKSAMDSILQQLKSAVMVAETDVPGLAAMLELALADNLAAGTPPPFKLIEVVESLGLGQIQPNPATSLEIVNGLLAELAPEQTDAAAVARAYRALDESEFEGQWFEAGEALETLLLPVKGEEQRIARMLADYLPGRRSYWARLCALSALALRSDKKSSRSLWPHLALIGRDLAGDAPLAQIPLMRQIARASARALELQNTSSRRRLSARR